MLPTPGRQESEGKTMDKTAEPVRAETAATEQLLDELRQRIGPQKFNAWFRHGTQVAVEEVGVRVSVPNTFVAGWVETHYQSEIAGIAEARLGKKLPVMISVDPELCRHLRRNDLDSQADIVAKTSQGLSRPRRPVAGPSLKYKLEEFVVGDSNRLAYSAAMAVGREGKPPFNPLFVHGPCGVGKTHLLQGICNAVRKRTRGKSFRWRYVTGEHFTNEYICAVRNKSFNEFRLQFRQLDLLAIDDIHFLAAKRSTQEEFLHTFNAIESAGKQIVLASDTHPNMVSNFNPQLMNRFVAGMVVKIDTPDHETRLGILNLRAMKLKLQVPQAVLEYISMHIRGSVRELEGALVKLAAVASLENGPVTMELARSILSEYLARTDSALTLGDIETVVAAYFGISPADIHSSRRTRTVSLARMMAMYLVRKHTTMSFPEIGRAMGKNHSSVVLAVQKLTSALAENAEVTWATPAGPKSRSARDLVDMLAAQFA